LIPRAAQIRFRRSLVAVQGASDFPSWPVDFSLDDFQKLLLQWLMALNGLPELPMIWFWPDRHQAAVILTHDVEMQAGHDHVREIAALERRYGFRSAWNFVPRRYQVDNHLLAELQQDGFEIGVHGLYHDGRLFESRQIFESRVEAINGYLRDWHSVGFRAPSAIRNLRWIAGRIQARYDSSCPTSEIHGPQPGGCCTVFPFAVGPMIELPISMPQDHTLLEILRQPAKPVWIETATQIVARNGLINIIVHPDYMLSPEHLAHYEAFLQWLKAQTGIWNALPGQVAEWWSNRRQQELVYADSHWQVSGPDAGRASVATVISDARQLAIRLNSQPIAERVASSG
jgi:hypothetical protein